MLKDAIRALLNSKKIVFVTGAGISQESGIPTFRGKDGLWRRHDPMKLATIDAFNEDPALVWEWYEDRRRAVCSAVPNPGHAAIAELEEFYSVSVLTQNIDELHQRAGSSSVLELHGSIVRTKCTACDFHGRAESFAELPPACECGGILRPDVVWFGEPLCQEVWNGAAREAEMCDMMIIAGTSLKVSPANRLPELARQNGAFLAEINPEKTEMTGDMDVSIRDTSSRVLPRLVEAAKSNG